MAAKLEQADRIGAAAAEELAVFKQTVAALDLTIDHALAFRRGLLTLPLAELPAAAIDVLRGIRDFERTADLIDLPSNGTEVLPTDLQRRFSAWERSRD